MPKREREIQLDELELLGSDYSRNCSYYLDKETGDLFCRWVELIKDATGEIRVGKSQIYLMVPGPLFYDQSPVLTRDN